MHGGMPLESPAVRNILENDVAAITTYSKEVLRYTAEIGVKPKKPPNNKLRRYTPLQKPNRGQPHHPVTVIYVGRLEPVQTPDLVA
jgi:hypothetical protein